MTSKEWAKKPENKSHILNYSRMWRVDNPEKAKARDKRHHAKHREARNEYCRNYYAKTKEKQKAKAKARYNKNRDKITAASREKHRKEKLQKIVEGTEWRHRVDDFNKGIGGSRMTWHIRAGGKVRCFIDGVEVDLTK